jgi:hypothetical protein
MKKKSPNLKISTALDSEPKTDQVNLRGSVLSTGGYSTSRNIIPDINLNKQLAQISPIRNRKQQTTIPKKLAISSLVALETQMVPIPKLNQNNPLLSSIKRDVVPKIDKDQRSASRNRQFKFPTSKQIIFNLKSNRYN